MTARADQFRLRVRYQKDGRLAYLGHLELVNTINRCVRRSGLPFAVGNGFACRIRLQFSQALPVGAASVEEYYDLLLTEPVDAGEALESLADATPAPLSPLAAAYVPHELAALESWLTRARWRIDFLGPVDKSALIASIEALRAQGVLEYRRADKHKHVDLQSSLVSWGRVLPEDFLLIDTHTDGAGSLRPMTLLSAAADREGIDLPPLRVCRMGQWHEEDGRLVEAIPSTG